MLITDAWRRYQAPVTRLQRADASSISRKGMELKPNASRYNFVTLDRGMIVDRFSPLS